MYENRRYPRHIVDAPIRIRVGDNETDGVIHDISQGGAGIVCESMFENDMFVELQTEGSNPMTGRVIRHIQGGFALEFEGDNEVNQEALDEIAKFRAIKGGDIG